jgi:hypothetical protein
VGKVAQLFRAFLNEVCVLPVPVPNRYMAYVENSSESPSRYMIAVHSKAKMNQDFLQVSVAFPQVLGCLDGSPLASGSRSRQKYVERRAGPS